MIFHREGSILNRLLVAVVCKPKQSEESDTPAESEETPTEPGE